MSNIFRSSWRSTFFAIAGSLILVSNVNATAITGGTTSVALNSGTVTALVGLGFSIAPVAPSTLNGLTATFPITGGDTTTMIDHSGGLALTDNSVTADIENFVINLSTDTITGTLVAGSTTASGVTFFDLGAGGSLTLDAALAGDLSAAFGVPNLTGAAIGTATVAAITATPEPAAVSLAGLGLLTAAFIGRRKGKICNK